MECVAAAVRNCYVTDWLIVMFVMLGMIGSRA